MIYTTFIVPFCPPGSIVIFINSLNEKLCSFFEFNKK